ncbi:MAG: Zn-dependent hydrolase [Verrucomicrobiae bacterium]|nr:Zn-dependent hydrolase [Verrucomicrobiae bacterium]
MPVADILHINLERLKRDHFELSEIGRNEEDRGIYRTAFSNADMEGRRWLMAKLEEIGIEAHMDGAANVHGLLEHPDTKKRFVIGSHIDTVPCAGTLDGALGVLVALESIRCIKEIGANTGQAIEIVAFSDEEGRFGGMFGSESYVGAITPETLQYFSDLENRTLAEAMSAQGLEPLKALEAKRDSSLITGYLEVHIEQGPVLYSQRKQVGLVENITGLFKWLIRIHGEANHAGTTPMELRHDAFLGLAEFANELPRILEENGSDYSRATIGKAQILPGAPNTVPGLVEFTLDVRDPSAANLEELGPAMRKALSAIARRRKLKFEFEEQSFIRPVNCDEHIVSVLQRQADFLELDYLKLPSGAAHDAQMVANIAPIGMIFVPSKDGLSHSPAEWTDWDHIEAGANLALNTLTHLSR